MEINSLSWDVRPRLFGVLFFKELEEFCISVLDELLLSLYIKSKQMSFIFKLPAEVDLPSQATSA